MGTMLGYRCVDCDNLKIEYEGIGMRGEKARSSERFACPSCSASLSVDSSSYDWQWAITWCGTCHHAFIPLFADYYPGMTFEEASRAHSEEFTVKVTSSDTPAKTKFFRQLEDLLGPAPAFNEENGAIGPGINIDEILPGVAEESGRVTKTVRGRLVGMRPCTQCGGDTFEELGGIGFWD